MLDLLLPAATPRRRAAATTAAALVALLAASASADAAPRPDVRPTKVHAPTAATAGGLLAVRLTAEARTAKAPRSGVAIYLSADAKRSRSDVRLRVTDRLAPLQRGRKRTTPLTVTLPAGGPGSTG